MKKILLLMLVCFSAVLAMAQKPMNTHYVYEVRNNQGTLIQSRAVTCTLKVVKNTNDTIFKETHSATTDNLGRITVTLGKGTSLGETEYNNVSWSKTDNYFLYATVKTDTLILGSEVPLLVGGNADSTTVVNLFGTKLPLARVATSGSYSDLTNRPTSMSQFDNDAQFLTSDSTVITTMQSNIQTNQSDIQTNQSNIATNTTNIDLLKLTNFDTIYNLSQEDAKLHLTKNYGFKIFNWGTLSNDEAAVYIINRSADTVTKTSALTAKDDDLNPSMTAFLAGKDPTLGQAAVIGTVNQSGNPVVMGALGYSDGTNAAAVMANGPIAFINGNYATDINNTNALSENPSNFILVTEATLAGSIPSTVAQLSDANDYAKLAADNTFSGNNTFSGTVTVPSGFNLDTTTSVNCNNLAVNACDLLTVFDSIQRQFTALRTEIDGLRDSLQRLRGASVPDYTSMTFADKTETSLTATADFDDGGATITEYNFCISTSADMSDATCQTSTEATYTFNDLQRGTQYYVTVAATNLKGTTTSEVKEVKTVYADPQLSDVSATAIGNTEIKVTGQLTDMGGSTPTTVTVNAYTSEIHSGETPVATADVELSEPGDFDLKVTGLTKNTTYYLDVIADNGEKQDTVTVNATTLNVEINISSGGDEGDGPIRAGSNVDVTVIYTAGATGTSSGNGFSWTVNGTDSSSVTNTLTVHYTDAGTYTVVCAYNDVADTIVTVVVICDTITFVPNGGTSGSMDEQVVIRGEKTKLATNNFTHDGNWEFIGWNSAYDGSGTSYDKEDSITTDGNVTLHAQWHTWCYGVVADNESGNNRIDSVKDGEGNWYDVVQINDVCWLKEDLRTKKYANGNSIESENYTTQDSHSFIYKGRITNSICPNGWKVPSNSDWTNLTNYAANTYSCSGQALCSTSPDWGTNNSSSGCLIFSNVNNNKTGFSVSPYSTNDGGFAQYWCDFGSSTTSNVVAFASNSNVTILSDVHYGLDNLSAVRCVRNTASPEEPFSPIPGSDDSTKACKGQTYVSDVAGNTYPTVAIGSQCWMAENLRTTKYRSNSLSIQEVSNTTYIVENAIIVGGDGDVLYGVGVLNDICPTGWHTPTVDEWDTLFTYVGSQPDYQCDGSSFNYAKALASTSSDWGTSDVSCAIGNNVSQNNKTYFNIIPDGMGEAGFWGVSSSGNKHIAFSGSSVSASQVDYTYGGSYKIPISVRCVRDTVSPEEPDTPGGGDTPTGDPENACKGFTTVKDVMQNEYQIVALGTQCWMAENLRTTYYSSGGEITQTNSVTTNDGIFVDGTNVYYRLNELDNICPNGWHTPTISEWETLFTFVGSQPNYQCGSSSSNYAKALASKSEAWGTSSVPCAIGNEVSQNNATNFNIIPLDFLFGNGAVFWGTSSNDMKLIRFTKDSTSYTKDNYSGSGYKYIAPVRCVRNADN